LNRGEIDKIVLTRPAESAEEEMGHLPGELEEKYDPYLRPVKEALEEYFGTGHLEYLLRNKIVEAIPLGFMRGATLKNAWVIADEMQNATKGQIKMFLTRFGENAKFVVNGDPKQVDIDAYKSGLMDAVQRTAHIDAIKFIQFTKDDIVREGLVQEIVEAYEEA
jgi:phosphate starvation-inducible PhoH-like protein